MKSVELYFFYVACVSKKCEKITNTIHWCFLHYYNILQFFLVVKNTDKTVYAAEIAYAHLTVFLNTFDSTDDLWEMWL